MTKKEKLYFLMFLCSAASLAAAVILKLCGVHWFDSGPLQSYNATILGAVIVTAINILHGYFILGSITWLKPKELLIKYLPFVILNFIPVFIPGKLSTVLTLAVFFAIALSIHPGLSTILKYVYAMVSISIIQIASVWVKYSVVGLSNVQADLKNFVIGNIDVTILMCLFYIFNMKWGDKYVLPKLAFFRKRK